MQKCLRVKNELNWSFFFGVISMRLLREPMSNVVFLQARTVGALFFIVYSPRYFRAFIDMVQIVDNSQCGDRQ